MSSSQEAHDVGHRRVQEGLQSGRQDGDVDVGPGERVEQGCHGLAHQHQLLKVGGIDKDLQYKGGIHK